MAKEVGVQDPPNAGGGGLLTDRAFGKRAFDLFDHTETPTFNDIDLLKVGRHFRLDEHTKLVIGRGKEENANISLLALPDDIKLEAKDVMGPTALLRGKTADQHKELAASITLRYSDAPKDSTHIVILKKDACKEEVEANHAQEKSYLKFRI